MHALTNWFRTAADVEAAPVAELAGGVLRSLARQLVRFDDAVCTRNLLLSAHGVYNRNEAVLSISEALTWLWSEKMLCQHVAKDQGWFTLTRLGRAAAQAQDFGQWTADRLLPAETLHPELHAVCLPLFRQGHFDTAVFEAFKTLEVAVRDAAGLGDGLVGVHLVRAAFKPEGGPLSDPTAEGGEREALANLMAGAIGSYKNPQSHRRVGVDAAEAREMVILASHLLRIVDSRRAAG